MIKTKVFNILTRLLATLPNLEKLEDPTLCSYIPILDALEDSRLTRFKTLIKPDYRYQSSEVANYVTCALLMKNRLESLLISDNYVLADRTIREESFFKRLYSEIHLFNNLTTINIVRKTNEEIQVLEHIVESCKLLQDVNFAFEPSDINAPFNTNITIAVISNFTPRPNVKTLRNFSRNLHDHRLLIYIMHKFPNLSLINSNISEGHSNILLDEDTVTKFLHYTSNVEEVEVSGLRMNENTIGKSFATFWQATTCNQESQYVLNIHYTNADSAGIFEVCKSEKIVTISLFFSLNGGWKHFGFIEKSGKYLKKVRFENDRSADVLEEVPGNFMAHTITHCPNLQNLHIYQFNFEPPTLAALEPNYDFHLDELSLVSCSMTSTLLEQWSRLIPKIKKLILSSCDQVDDEDGSTISLKSINMKYTKVDSIVIGNNFSSPDSVKLVVSSTNECYYYYQHRKKLERTNISSGEKEYLEFFGDDFDRIYICCRTEPNIVLGY